LGEVEVDVVVFGRLFASGVDDTKEFWSRALEKTPAEVGEEGLSGEFGVVGNEDDFFHGEVGLVLGRNYTYVLYQQHSTKKTIINDCFDTWGVITNKMTSNQRRTRSAQTVQENEQNGEFVKVRLEKKAKETKWATYLRLLRALCCGLLGAYTAV